MKKKLLTAIAFSMILTANAQWQIQNPGFTKDTVQFYELSLPDKNTAWGVCYDFNGGLPGPTDNVVNVVLEDGMINTRTVISIINSNGGVIESRISIAAKSVQMNVARLVAGLYIVRIESGGKMVNKTIAIVR